MKLRFKPRTPYEREFGRPMNGWARGGRGKRAKWHQVEWDNRTNEAVLCCSGRIIVVDGRDVMDYRWRPSGFGVGTQCSHPQCRKPVEP